MTMFELMIVVFIISAIGMVALPRLLDARHDYRLSAVAREVSGNLSLARIRAVTENADYRVRVADTSTYVMEEDVTGTWTARASYEMPAGFSIETAGAIVEFHYRGNATPVTSFTITNPNSNTRDVVTTTSGRSYVQ